MVIEHPVNKLVRIGTEGMAAVCSDGCISLVSVKMDENTVQLMRESEVVPEEEKPVYNMVSAVQVTND